MSFCFLKSQPLSTPHHPPPRPLQIQNIQLEREMALASNRSLAEQNLDMKPRLESQKEVLVERYCQLEAVRDTYRQHGALRGRIRWMVDRWGNGHNLLSLAVHPFTQVNMLFLGLGDKLDQKNMSICFKGNVGEITASESLIWPT